MCSCSPQNTPRTLGAMAGFGLLLELILFILYLTVEASDASSNLSRMTLTIFVKNTFVPAVHYFLVVSCIILIIATRTKSPALMIPYVMSSLAMVLCTVCKIILTVVAMSRDESVFVVYARITNVMPLSTAKDTWKQHVLSQYTDAPSAVSSITSMFIFSIFWNLCVTILYGVFAAVAISGVKTFSGEENPAPVPTPTPPKNVNPAHSLLSVPTQTTPPQPKCATQNGLTGSAESNTKGQEPSPANDKKSTEGLKSNEMAKPAEPTKPEDQYECLQTFSTT
ncbi:hypothetical protein QR680_006882 [Steinernema hermaphroditum]|uniref:Uncharacterized protein n=1 Tax=Steinernema hermaphroditum TaxID=289476 RepID=A0AA39HY20_9BILA|nr:hypothetical protein QR680_006882 [Steinernema hermaphroditum]